MIVPRRCIGTSRPTYTSVILHCLVSLQCKTGEIYTFCYLHIYQLKKKKQLWWRLLLPSVMELNTLPSGILTKILQYLISPNDTNNYGRKSDDLKVLRTISCSCRAFFTLLQQDQTWRTMYPSSKCNRTSYLLFSTSLQERHR